MHPFNNRAGYRLLASLVVGLTLTLVSIWLLACGRTPSVQAAPPLRSAGGASPVLASEATSKGVARPAADQVPAAIAGVQGAIKDQAAVGESLPEGIGLLTLNDASPDWIADGEGAGDFFGVTVASAGDVNGDGYADAVIGAIRYSDRTGRAYVYYGKASGLNATPAVTLTGESMDNQFGYSLASAGDVNGDGYADLVVAADRYNDHTGRAYVYHGGASGLNATPALTLTGEVIWDHFGSSAASAGDVNGDGYADLVVGADGCNDDTGRAYLYHGGPGGLSAAPVLTLTGEGIDSQFGTSVASAGDVNGDGYADLLVGASVYNEGTGQAYVYHGGASGLSVTPALTLTGEAVGSGFGGLVASAGDVNGDGYADIVVGAGGYNDHTGRVYVYHGEPGGLSATPALTLSGEDTLNYFGGRAAPAGDLDGDGYADLVVGAGGYNSAMGRAYLYHGGVDGLSPTPTFTLSGETVGAGFGSSVASAGDVNGDGYADIIAGALGYDSDAGRAYLYHGGASGLDASPILTITEEGMSNSTGDAVASAGDVNGDGYADVVIGAARYDNNTGQAYIYHGGAGGLSAAPALTLTGEGANNYFGTSVATAGDVNGDGYADLVVGADGYNNHTGRAYVYHGAAGGLSTAPAITLTGEATWDYFGSKVASAGDVNGDGYADLLVGAGDYNDHTGRVHVYHGEAGGLSANPALTLSGESAGDLFGGNVASAGDVNGDGYADVAVGAFGYNSSRGRVYVYHGGPGGLGATPALILSGESSGAYFGESLASAGDVNSDGYADLLVGVTGYNDFTGQAYLYHGGAGGLNATPALTLSGEDIGDHFGASVASAGDVNGDGYADGVVGAFCRAYCAGQAYVYHGGPGGLSAAPALTLTEESLGDYSVYFGWSLASAGDVNGDSYADLVVGADTAGGRAYVYLGNGNGGRQVLARQVRADGSGVPVQHWGLSHAPDAFQAGIRATDPMGRGRVKLQVQACPPGVPFGDATCIDHISPAWTDLTASSTGVGLGDMVSGLTSRTLYRWRARVLYAPFHVTAPGISPPPNPAHGPWRRFLGQAFEADLRTTAHSVEVDIAKSVIALPSTEAAGYQSTITYTRVVSNVGTVNAENLLLTDTLPISTTFARWLERPVGAGLIPGSPEEITWNGLVIAGEVIIFRFVVSHTGDYGDQVTNMARYHHASGSGVDEASFRVESAPADADIYLPIIFKNVASPGH